MAETSHAQAADCRALTQGRVVPGRHGISACRRCPASRTRLSRGYAGVCCVRRIDGSSAVPLPKLAVSTTRLFRGTREHRWTTDRLIPSTMIQSPRPATQPRPATRRTQPAMASSAKLSGVCGRVITLHQPSTVRAWPLDCTARFAPSRSCAPVTMTPPP